MRSSSAQLGLTATALAAAFAPHPTHAAALDPRCITVKDVVIVSGSEAWADKKLCKSPGSARYDVIEVAQAVYGAASTQAAFEKASDPQLRELRGQIDVLRAKVAGAGEEASAARLALLSAQGKFVAGLAGKDRAYAEAIAQFRGTVADLAAQPEGVAALGQYNAGDEAGALAILDRLHEANEAARQTQSNIASAAELRRIAGLALDARGKGKITTAAVIARFEAVTRLDPRVFQDWLNLSRLDQDAGRIGEARQAIERAMATAQSDRDGAIALAGLGDILIGRGDVAGASRAYAECLVLVRKRAAADPGNSEVQRDLTVSLNKIGDVRLAQGDLVGAHQAFAEARLTISARAAAVGMADTRAQRDLSVSFDRVGDVLLAEGNLAAADREYAQGLSIRRGLATLDPGNAQAQRDISVSLIKIGDLRSAQRDSAGEDQAYAESLAIRRKLSGNDPSNALAQRDVSVCLDRIGDALAMRGDLAEAGKVYKEGLEIIRRLAASADPGNTEPQRDIAVGLSKVGEMQLAQHDPIGALKAYDEVLGISRAVAKADPGSAEAQRDLWVILFKLAGLRGSSVRWSEVVRQILALEAQGMLTAPDRPFLEQARTNAVRETSK